MDDHILERCYAIQNDHLSLDEAIEYQHCLGLKIAHGELAQQIYCANSPRCMSYVADCYQIALYLEELRCARNDIAKLKAEVKELRETNRRYKDMLRDFGGNDDETIQLEDFIKAFYKHLEEHHNEENKDS